MKVLVMTNGEYGNLDWYKKRKAGFEQVICVDGGAGWARKLGITPNWVVGDMDSIDQEDRMYMEREGVQFSCHPSQKDPTDTEIALQLAEQLGADEIIIWGGTGSRLDHTLSNLFSAAYLALLGKTVQFDSPIQAIYLVKDMLKLSGQIGKTVSVLAMGGEARGVTLEGFQYPLKNAEVDSMWQYGISNVIISSTQVVSVASGILAVFYYRELP
ncbi:MAG TPA: thiamine diphosphokinase [Peptococcaceae bacterium]|nr:thiamine diphosphokinase [Peptococcaceae bacterium]HBI27694.1 thiamine diphosphokinase [Peptococcaceae bacterium]